MKQIAFFVDDIMHTELKTYCAENKTNITQLLRRLIDDEIHQAPQSVLNEEN